jgi:choline kinase
MTSDGTAEAPVKRTIDKAVILAAGLGNRISAVSRDTPKPLLPLDGNAGGTTFLDWHLMALAKVGCREIYIVGNHKTFGTKLRATDGVKPVKVEWISNPTDDLSTSGSGHSAWFAFESAHRILDGTSRVALMDADIVYDAALLGDLANAGGDASKTLVCATYRHTHEEVLVFADESAPHAPRFHGKGLLGTKLVSHATCLGEATGILLWEPQDHALLREATAWTIRYSTAKARSEHEDITQRMMSLGRMSAVTFGAERTFMEVDTPEEYRACVDEVFPRLRA